MTHSTMTTMTPRTIHPVVDMRCSDLAQFGLGAGARRLSAPLQPDVTGARAVRRIYVTPMRIIVLLQAKIAAYFYWRASGV
jgi:hypothetical protein